MYKMLVFHAISSGHAMPWHPFWSRHHDMIGRFSHGRWRPPGQTHPDEADWADLPTHPLHKWEFGIAHRVFSLLRIRCNQQIIAGRWCNFILLSLLLIFPTVYIFRLIFFICSLLCLFPFFFRWFCCLVVVLIVKRDVKTDEIPFVISGWSVEWLQHSDVGEHQDARR